jgi:hypothetical protein
LERGTLKYIEEEGDYHMMQDAGSGEGFRMQDSGFREKL